MKKRIDYTTGIKENGIYFHTLHTQRNTLRMYISIWPDRDILALDEKDMKALYNHLKTVYRELENG